MADNFQTNAGSGGNTYASDDVAGVHYPIGKMAYGALDSVTLVTTSSGFPVQFVGGTTLADDVANPSVPYVAAFGMVYDGTTWDRLRGTAGAINIHDGGNTITVDGTVSVSGTVTVDTELVAAALLADNTSNPTVTSVGTFPHWYDGSTWDRAKGDSTDGLLVNLGINNDVTQSGTWTVQPGNTANTTPWLASIHDGTTKATVRELGTNDALNVSICDGSGNQITSFGGGTQYAEDSAHVSGDSVTMAGVVQQSADAALSNDGDRSVLQVDANGYLKVNIKAGAGSGGTASTDDAAFTAASGSGTPMMGFVTADTVDSGDVGVVGMLANRQLKVTLYDSGGVELAVGGGTQYDEDTAHVSGDKVTMAGVVQQTADSALAGTDGDRTCLQVDATGYLKTSLKTALPAGTNNIGDVDVLSVIPGTAATNLGKAEDDPHTSGDVGVMALTVRQTSAGALAGTSGDYQPLITDSSGRLYCVAKCGGDIAHDNADNNSNPVKIGGYASSTAPTAVSANADIVNAWLDLNGRQVVWIDQALPAGTNAIGKLAANSGVDIGDVDVTSVTPGTTASALGKAEDAAHTTGDVGVMALAVRQATATDLSAGGTDGDYEPLQVDASGRLHVNVGNTVTVGTHAVTQSGGWTVSVSGTVTVDSELPTAAALADNTANPTVPAVGSFLMGYDGTNWDRIRADGGSVFIQDGGNSITVDGTVSVSGTVTVDSELPTAAALADNTANPTAPAVGSFLMGYDGTNWDRVRADGGSVFIQDGGNSITVDDGGTSLTVDGAVNLVPATSGGLSFSNTISAASTNATSLKASAGQVYSVFVSSINAAARYLKLYNKATAPTVGTDTPVATFLIPGNTAGAGFTISWENGLAFATGIAFALTTGVANSDTGAVSANEHVVIIGYK